MTEENRQEILIPDNCMDCKFMKEYSIYCMIFDEDFKETEDDENYKACELKKIILIEGIKI